MTELNTFLLTAIVFIPALGGLVILLTGETRPRVHHWLAAVFTGLTLLLSFVLLASYKTGLASPTGKESGFQFVDRLNWIPHFGIQYQVGVDGLSLPMVVLTALLLFIAVFASWNIQKRSRLYFFLLLVMETGVLGVFSSLDLFLFFVMWELELIPMYFLIGLWGGPRREYAAIKFILYTMFGSALMLAVFLIIYFFSGTHSPGLGARSFDLILLLQQQNVLSNMTPAFRTIMFIALFIGFAIKLPMFPFHTWLPDAHVEAPTPISVILAGVLLKMGAYGIIRLNFGLFPEIAQSLALGLAIMGMINIIYGAFLALAQEDMKRVIAYSSVSHMGFVLLGLAAFNPLGLNGAILQMFTHGTITALLFLFVGMIYDRTHTRVIQDLGGLSQRMPLACALFVLTALAAIGAPGLSGFVSEFLVLAGAYSNTFSGQTQMAIQGLTIVSALSIILGAAYMLWLTQRVFFGPLKGQWTKLADINRIEMMNVFVLLLFVIVLGIYPAWLVDLINPAAEQILALGQPRLGGH